MHSQQVSADAWSATACPAAAPQPATTVFAISNPANNAAVGALKVDAGAELGGGGTLETLDDEELGSGVSVEILQDRLGSQPQDRLGSASKEVTDQLLSLFAARQDIEETVAASSPLSVSESQCFLLPIPDDERYERPSSGISRFGAENWQPCFRFGRTHSRSLIADLDINHPSRRVKSAHVAPDKYAL